jgi:5-methylcytosine-specific restriction endonuclease McrA
LNTTATSTQYDEHTLFRIWLKSKEVPGTNGVDVRLDRYGNLMRFSQYGKTTEHGWEVDHRVPDSWGGPSDLSNLQPLHWQANRQKSDHLQ